MFWVWPVMRPSYTRHVSVIGPSCTRHAKFFLRGTPGCCIRYVPVMCPSYTRHVLVMSCSYRKFRYQKGRLVIKKLWVASTSVLSHMERQHGNCFTSWWKKRTRMHFTDNYKCSATNWHRMNNTNCWITSSRTIFQNTAYFSGQRGFDMACTIANGLLTRICTLNPGTIIWRRTFWTGKKMYEWTPWCMLYAVLKICIIGSGHEYEPDGWKMPIPVG